MTTPTLPNLYTLKTNVSDAELYAFSFTSDGYSTAGDVLPKGITIVTQDGYDGYYIATLPASMPLNGTQVQVVWFDASVASASTTSTVRAYVHSINTAQNKIGIVTQSNTGTLAKLTARRIYVSILVRRRTT
jgi:hypothetical protein